MSRTFRAALAVAPSGLALTATAPASAAKTGQCRPGFTIELTLGGKKVTKKGVRYRFQISDRSSIHDFHLIGPGVNRVLTGVDFTGTKSVLLRLRKGTYRFICDPHASSMHGKLPGRVTGWNKAHPPFSRGLSTAERAVFTGALWRTWRCVLDADSYAAGRASDSKRRASTLSMKGIAREGRRQPRRVRRPRRGRG